MPRLDITVRRTGRKRIEELLLEKTDDASVDQETAAENLQQS